MLVSKCYNHQVSRKPPRISSRPYRTICTITAITPSRKEATWSEDYTHMSERSHDLVAFAAMRRGSRIARDTHTRIRPTSPCSMRTPRKV